MKIYGSILKIMNEMRSIEKTRSVSMPGANYKFRGIEDVFTNFHPLLIKYEVFCAPKIIRESTETFSNKSGNTSFRVTLVVEHTFYSVDGSFVTATTAGEGIDTSDKATNKAMSAAFKYAFFELFCVPTAQADDSDYPNPSIDGPVPGFSDNPETDYARGYFIPFGKFKNRTLEEVGPKDLANYIEYLERTAKKDSKEITGVIKEFIDNASSFIISFENQDFNQMN